MVRDSCLIRFKYDASGRSTGRASVWYENEADAHTAHNEFDGAQAKGETIIVTVGDTRPLPDSRGAQHQQQRPRRTLSLADRLALRQEPRTEGRMQKSDNARRRTNKRASRASISAAELDAELDEFMKAPAQEPNDTGADSMVTDP